MSTEIGNEKKFYEKDGILITSSRCVLRGKTYPIANISSVSGVKLKPQRKSQYYLLILYLFIALIIGGVSQNSLVMITAFLIAIGLGIWGIMLKRVKYAVRINTAGQDTDGLVHQDETKIDEVINAINEAIVSRG
jgi:hypothetical protein